MTPPTRAVTEPSANPAPAELLYRIAERSPEVIGVVDSDLRLIVVNPAAVTAFREILHAEIEVGADLRSVLAHRPEAQRRAVELIERAFAGEEFAIVEPLRTGPGDLRFFEITFGSVPADGTSAAYFVARDVSARELAKAKAARLTAELEQRVHERTRALGESEALFRAMIVHAPIPVMVHTMAGEIIELSEAFTRLSGYTRDDISTGWDWVRKAYGLSADEAAAMHEQMLANRMSADSGLSVERTIRTKAGEERQWLFRGSRPHKLADGREVMVSMALDVTDRRRTEAALREAKEKAEQANRAKSDFMAVMSHELRTPLNAIIGYAELLEMGVPAALPAGAREQVERISFSARHLLQIIDEILTFSRLDAGHEQVTLAPTDLRALLDEVAAIVRPLAEHKELRFRTPATGGSIRIVTDPRKLRQILINLLGNAVKFTERGEVELRLERRGDFVALRVRDTGVGISPGDLPNLWDPFWRADSSHTRETDGTGLGLTIAYRFARMLGGDIDVESEVGEGSTFTVRLPLNPSAHLSERRTRADRRKGSAQR